MVDESTQGAELTEKEVSEIYAEIDEQPEWRRIADKEMDYADGNQLDNDLLRKQQELGIPPAIEDVIGPTLISVRGYEIAQRTDWRVTPDGQDDNQEVADAISYRLNKAERKSKADRALSEGFKAQIGCGIGWVEVSRNPDPFEFPYRCMAVHRNEIHWSMDSWEPDEIGDQWPWLKRQRWMTPERVASRFPEHKDLILRIGQSGPTYWGDTGPAMDGGFSTGLRNSWAREKASRAWTPYERHWYSTVTKQVSLSEIWYRRWIDIPVLKMPDGRVVEWDENNIAHALAIQSGIAEVLIANVPKLRRAYWLGPYQLDDAPTPFEHRFLPYVPMFGFREDLTGIPYGYVRGMKYQQDSLNSGNSKLRWGMSVVRTERTKGAVAMPDKLFRKMVARSDADIILDPEHMARQGARFDVKRDYTLSDQHYRMLEDNRASIERVSGITAGFKGTQGTATSGLQEGIQVEQSNQNTTVMLDNARAARARVGELLMSMIITDIGNKEEQVLIEGDEIRQERLVVLNQPTEDDRGDKYLTNDLQRARLAVELEEVPSTQSFRAQQLNSISEAVKSLPAEYQAVVTPFMFALTDTPFKREMIEAIRKVQELGSPEEIEKRVRQEVENELKRQELDIKAGQADAQNEESYARAVQIGVQAAFSAMQAGGQIAAMPQIAPIADAVMQSAGYQPPNPPGVDPNYPVPGGVPAGSAPVVPVERNTSPTFPPVPQAAGSGMTGIETDETGDNLP